MKTKNYSSSPFLLMKSEIRASTTKDHYSITMEYVRYISPCTQNRASANWVSRLGKSGLKVSKVILGAMSFGEPSASMGWTLPEAQALPVLKRAFDLGLNTWDTVIYPSDYSLSHKMLTKIFLGGCLFIGRLRTHHWQSASRIQYPS